MTTTQILDHTYTATATPARGGKRTITVLRDGEVFDTMTTKAPHAYVILQGWEGTDKVAPRYSRNTKRIGATIEYGHCIGVVPIEDAGSRPGHTEQCRNLRNVATFECKGECWTFPSQG